jgi:hypothetical protein
VDFFAGWISEQFYFRILTHIRQRVAAKWAVYDFPFTQIMLMFPYAAVGKAGL